EGFQLANPVPERQQLLLDAGREAQLAHPLERGSRAEGDGDADGASNEKARDEARPGTGHQRRAQRDGADPIALQGHAAGLTRSRRRRSGRSKPASEPITRTGSTSANARCCARWVGSGSGAAAPVPPLGRPITGCPGTASSPKAVRATAPDSRIVPSGRYSPNFSTSM